MAIKQLNPTLPLDTPKGSGQALFVIDYGPEHHLLFTVAIDETREIWTFDNTKVKVQKNLTMGRASDDKEKLNRTTRCQHHPWILCDNCEFKLSPNQILNSC